MTYKTYDTEPIKKNFKRTLKIYVILGLSLGFVFTFLLEQVSGTDLEVNGIEKILLSFGLSFSLIIILRISTLLNKSNILSVFVDETHKDNLLKKSIKYPYEKLKNEINSFLFSIFLAAMVSLTVYFFYSLLFRPDTLFSFSFFVEYLTLWNYILFMIFFIFVLGLITLVGEYLLYKIGVRPNM